jgi:uncharacterized membrane protein YvbJ
MNGLKEVLARYTGFGPHFGDAIEAPATVVQATNVDLSSDLKAISDKDRSYLLICVGMVLLIFLGVCVLTVKYLSDPAFVTKMFAASGISITGLVIQMMKFWKEKVNSDTVLVLARNLSPQDTRAIIEILLRS